VDRVYVTFSMFSASVVVPAIILAFLLAMFVYLMYAAQSRPDFDAANFIRDEQGKESIVRVCTLIALAITSWAIAALVFTERITPDYFFYYTLTWASTPMLKMLAEKWDGNLPFSPRHHPGGLPGGGFPGGGYPPPMPPYGQPCGPSPYGVPYGPQRPPQFDPRQGRVPGWAGQDDRQ